MRDIAEAAGVHFSTVSLALRNSPRLPRPTCLRVQRQARKLGYVPDPMLASLASYRQALRPVGYHATLAWVTAFPERDGWREVQIFREQYEGAMERAAELGYRIEHIWRAEPRLTTARVRQILRTRAINGLLIAPLPHAGGMLELDWDRYAAVAIGYSLAAPQLHLVSAHQYRCMRLAMQELRARGYRRIGLVMPRASDDRVDHNWLAGYLLEQHETKVERIEPLLVEKWDEQVFLEWMRGVRPDAVICKRLQVAPALQKGGWTVPENMGLAYLSDAHSGDQLSGVDENPRRVGAAAVDMLAGMLHRNELGIPEVPQRLLIDGTWNEGCTVRPRGGQL